MTRRILFAFHWAMPSFAALAMYRPADVPGPLVLAIVAACVLLRPIHTGPITRTAFIIILLSPVAPLLFKPFVWAHTLVSETWTSIGTIPSLLLRLPSYGIFAVVALVAVVIAQSLIVALIVRPVFALIERECLARQRHRDRTAAHIASTATDGAKPVPPFSLYLRPFTTTGQLPSNLIGHTGGSEEPGQIQTDFEAILASAFPAHRPLIALGTPGKLLSTHPEGWTFWPIDRTWDIPGTGKIASTEDGWRQTVSLLARHAELIVIVPLQFAGTLWEIEFLHAQGLLSKCVFVMPASQAERDYADAWRTVTPTLMRETIEPPEYHSSGRLFFLEAGSWHSLPSFVKAPLPRATALLAAFSLVRRRLRSSERRVRPPVLRKM